MPAIPEFSDAELANIREMLFQRYRAEVEIHLADSEIRVEKNATQNDEQNHDNTLTCPTVYWHARGANFVVFKIADDHYRTQFFYTPHDQFGTGIDDYNNLDECVAAVLQTQADHERERDGADHNQVAKK